MAYRTYRLTARKGDDEASMTVEAENSLEATIAAIAKIMNAAMGSPLWAKGYIELVTPEGDVIHTMAEKGEDE